MSYHEALVEAKRKLHEADRAIDYLFEAAYRREKKAGVRK